MRALGAADILRVWEAGQSESPVERALTLLASACPERTREELAALPLGERARLLLVARAEMLGGTLRAVADCPACGEALEFSLAVSDLLDEESDAEPGGELSAAGYSLRFRLPDSRDLAALSACDQAEKARALLLTRCVVDARHDGATVAASELPTSVVEALAERIAACDPRAEALLDLSCPVCAMSWRIELDVADFIWEELHSHALRLLGEVDTIARAYGWSQADILALSPERRRWYVSRVS